MLGDWLSTKYNRSVYFFVQICSCISPLIIIQRFSLNGEQFSVFKSNFKTIAVAKLYRDREEKNRLDYS